MAQNRITKTPERNAMRMSATRKAKIQKKREQRERNKAKSGNAQEHKSI